MQIDIALQNCHRLEDVVELINQDGTSEFDGLEIAAQYIFGACEEYEDYCEAAFDWHYDYLVENGSKINYGDVKCFFSQLKL